jgi:hypothetical protein
LAWFAQVRQSLAYGIKSANNNDRQFNSCGAWHGTAEYANYIRRKKMVCATRSFEALYSRMQCAVPSPDRIQQLELEIRNGWSPQTRARRAAAGAYRVDVILALAQLQKRENILNRLRSH